jgi:glycosyltransferase involved in cell wall biosynthesis
MTGIYLSSDGVVTASDVEAAVLDEEIPSIPALSFPVAAEEPRITERGPGRHALFLGNFAHAPNLDGMTWWLEEIQPGVRERLGEEFTVRVVGSGSEQHAGEWSDRTDVVGWVPDLTEEFDETRVFVVPLRFGAGTKGKITVAVAHGVPVITTPIGAEGFADPILGALRVCDTAADFADAVVELMSDDEAWKHMRARTVAAARDAWAGQGDLGVGLSSWVARRRPLALAEERRSGAVT